MPYSLLTAKVLRKIGAGAYNENADALSVALMYFAYSKTDIFFIDHPRNI